jgi:low affinity Fe/Cu permease
LKVNELLASHEPAKNTVINMEAKTEHEINELSKEYSEMAEELKADENVKSSPTSPTSPDTSPL